MLAEKDFSDYLTVVHVGYKIINAPEGREIILNVSALVASSHNIEALDLYIANTLFYEWVRRRQRDFRLIQEMEKWGDIWVDV